MGKMEQGMAKSHPFRCHLKICLYLFYGCKCLHACVYVHREHAIPMRARRRDQLPQSWSYRLSCGCWELSRSSARAALSSKPETTVTCFLQQEQSPNSATPHGPSIQTHECKGAIPLQTTTGTQSFFFIT